MPWSTWTTWSPTLRSRKSDRKARAGVGRRSAARRSSSNRSVSANSCRCAAASRKPRDSAPVTTRIAAPERSPERLLSGDLVLPQDLDDAFRPAGCRRDEDHPVTRLTGLPDRRGPVGHPPAILDRALAGDVDGLCGLVFVVERQFLEPRGRGEARAQRVEIEGQSRRWIDGCPLGHCIAVAGPDLFQQLRRRSHDGLLFGDEQRGVGKVVEQRRSPIESLAAAGQLERVAERLDDHGIDGDRGSLRRRVVASHRLDRVAQKLEPDRLRVIGREDVHHAAPPAELAVLVHRVLAREAGIDEQFGQDLRIDVRADLQRDRGTSGDATARSPAAAARPPRPRRRAPVPRRQPQARGPWPTPRGGGAASRGTDPSRVRGTGNTAAADASTVVPSSAERKNRRSPVICSTSRSDGTTRHRGWQAAAEAGRCAVVAPRRRRSRAPWRRTRDPRPARQAHPSPRGPAPHPGWREATTR